MSFLVLSFYFRWLDALCPAIAFSETLWMSLPECRLCYLNKTGLCAFSVSFQESLFGVQTTGEVMKIQITYETRVLLDTLGGFYCVPRWQNHYLKPIFLHLLSNSDYLNLPRLSELTQSIWFFSDYLSSFNLNSRHVGMADNLSHPQEKKAFSQCDWDW